MSESYPIKIWSGLLSDGHVQKIENALWEFIWLVGKVTKEEDGKGYVLGGTPIKINDICKDLKRNYKTVYRHLKQLEKHGYIIFKRVPYGLIITVNNSKKFGYKEIKRVDKNVQTEIERYDKNVQESGQKCPTDMTNLSSGYDKNVHSNKILKDTKRYYKDTKTLSEDSIEYKLSHYLFEKIKEHNPKAKEPNFKEWAKSIDLMIRVDKREPEEIKKVIDWCQADDFWYTNILSTVKLRKQYDQLVIKMNKKNNNKKINWDDIKLGGD